MKARKNLSTRAASLLLALLLLATAGLTACDKTNDPTGTDPSDTTAQAPENGGMTLPEGTAPADPEAPTDPADTAEPPKKGCRSSLSVGLTTLILLAASLTLGKKRHRL